MATALWHEPPTCCGAVAVPGGHSCTLPLLLPPLWGREQGSGELELGPFLSLCVSVCVCLCSSCRAGLQPQ